MEGVMMRNKEDYAVAVRKPDGEMAVVKDVYKGIIPSESVKNIPILRGIAGFIDSLVLGMKALNISADFFAEEEGDSKADKKKNGNPKTEGKESNDAKAEEGGEETHGENKDTEVP